MNDNDLRDALCDLDLCDACDCFDGLDDVEFEVGDVVSLIVGGPDMVVISIAESDCLEVAWADSDGDVNVDVFPAEALCHALLG